MRDKDFHIYTIHLDYTIVRLFEQPVRIFSHVKFISHVFFSHELISCCENEWHKYFLGVKIIPPCTKFNRKKLLTLTCEIHLPITANGTEKHPFLSGVNINVIS